MRFLYILDWRLRILSKVKEHRNYFLVNLKQIFQKGLRFLKNPKPYLKFLYRENLRIKSEFVHNYAPYSFLDDKLNIKYRFYSNFGYKINLNNPKTFNEKIQWRKLFERDPFFTILADKNKVREYVKHKIGSEYLIPLLGVYNNPQEVNWSSSQEKFVIKPNHGAGCVIYCDDMGSFDRDSANKEMEVWIRTNFYHISREWQYKNIDPKIIFEKFIESDTNSGLTDYKFFCFDGKPKLIQVNVDRYTKHSLLFYSPKWKKQNMSLRGYPISTRNISKPKNLEIMLEIASQLSKGISFCRVDLYNVKGKVLFGEITLTPNGGNVPIVPYKKDLALGNLMHLTRYSK